LDGRTTSTFNGQRYHNKCAEIQLKETQEIA